MDLPLITEATSDYYRNIYADPDLGPIFKGINMVVLRTHVSYFIHQLTMFDTPMTQRQIEYLRKVHTPVIQEHNVTQRHYDIMVSYLLEAMRTNGAQDEHLNLVLAKLEPLRDLFPPNNSSSVDGTVVLQDEQQQQATAPAADSSSSRPPSATKPSSALTASDSTGLVCPAAQQSVFLDDSRNRNKREHCHQDEQTHTPAPQVDKPLAWVRRLTSCMCRS